MEEIISRGADKDEMAQGWPEKPGVPPRSFPPEPLLEGHELRVIRPPISHFADRIRSGRRFSFTKINHGHWEKVLALQGHPSVARLPALRQRARIFLDHGGKSIGLFERLGFSSVEERPFHSLFEWKPN